MKLITWNCRAGGFRHKAKYIASQRPDVLAVQEVEPLDPVQVFAGDYQPTFWDRSAEPAFPRRGIGVFSYTDTQFTAVDQADRLYSFRRYEARHRGMLFNVIAVWPWQTKSSRTAYRQAHEGIARHSDWIRQRPTVILGDFNANASFNGRNWPDLMGLLTPLGLVSAYHRYFELEHGRECHSTHFHKGRQTPPFHLDYCFVPECWISRLKSVEVGSYADWHGTSDHAPVIVELEFEQ